MKEKKEKVEFSKRTRRIIYALLWLGALSPVLVLTYLFTSQSEDDLPSVEMLENPPELLASVVLSDDGKTELGRYWKVNRTSVAYKDISPYVFDALISTEDERFLEHSGIDFRAVGRMVYRLGSGGGASTITQQLAKQLFTLKQREEEAELRAQGKEIPRRGGKMGRLNEKIKENIIAVRLEERYTKKEIIAMYLNQFDFLYNAVGIENASKVYFNKTPMELSKSEAAMLVGMCKNPSYINPHTYQVKNYRSKIASRQGIAPEAVQQSEIDKLRAEDSTIAADRRNQVLYQWLKNSEKENSALENKITRAEYDSLILTPVITDYQVVDHKEGSAPYFRESLRSQLKSMFAEKKDDGSYVYAKEDGSPYDVYSDGLKIYTSINANLQDYAEQAVVKHLKKNLQPAFTKNNKRVKRFPFADHYEITDDRVERNMQRGRKSSERYRVMRDQDYPEAEIMKSFEELTPMKVFSWEGEIDTIMTPNDSIRYYKNLLRAGLISIEPSTGFIKAWVGGADFHHFSYDMVKQGKRQVGSTIKPFVYATALLMNACKPCTKFEDLPYCVDQFEADGRIKQPWCPKGDIPVGKDVSWALANSNNPGTVAVMSMMGGQSGPFNISKVLKDAGINLRPEDEVPAMCLGVMDLSLYELVGAQCIFVNDGIYTQPTAIMRIEDRNGNVIYEADPVAKEVLNSTVSYTILNMMKGVVQYGTGASLRGTWRGDWGGLTQPIAGKTGTTQNNADGWFMGLTRDLVTGVWVGAEDRDVRFRSMEWGQGARMALPIFGYYMQKAYADKKVNLSQEDFLEPIGYDPLRFSCDGDSNGGTETPPDWEF